MSENLNRSTLDFSKYDSMSIEELEKILRADAQGPERDNSDVDEILYVMEVLAKKRRQNGIAGKTALEAYQEFQQHYLPISEDESKPKRKSNIIPFRRIAAVAACLVLVFSLATSAHAFGWKDIWNAVARWAEETFSLSIGQFEENAPATTVQLEFSSLQEAITFDNIDSEIVPTYIPNEYVLEEICIDRNPLQDIYIAIYSNGKSILKVSLKSHIQTEPEKIEQSDGFVEIYTKNEVSYYIFTNYSQYRAAWINGKYECCIMGEIPISEIKLMIDSIEKG